MDQRQNYWRLLLAMVFFGATTGIFLSSLNNYLSQVHNLAAHVRGWLEFPREVPGFLMIFVIGGLVIYLRESQMAALAMLFTAIGGLGFAYGSSHMAMLVLWTVCWSLGDHVILALGDPLGLKLAKQGGEGRRLGQIGGARNLGTILGVGLLYILAKRYGDNYALFYTIAAICALIAGILYFQLSVGKGEVRSHRFVYRKEYHLFYAISALFGIRKQLFIVFGSWVLVSLHNVPVSTVALLYFIAAALGVIMRPLLGDVVDWLGERVVLASDEVLLLLICMTYAFASQLFQPPYDLHLLYGAYVLDIILFALRIARTTYLKKIALDPGDITPTVSLGITIDHAVAMSLPILSGYIWDRFGFQWVFVMAGIIAIAGFVVCLQIKVPQGNLKSDMNRHA